LIDLFIIGICFHYCDVTSAPALHRRTACMCPNSPRRLNGRMQSAGDWNAELLEEAE